MANQSHSGGGDNVGGNKVLNLTLPKILIIGIITILSIIAFIYWKSIKERFFFDEDKIDIAIGVIDSLQIRGLNEDESEIYGPDEIIYYDINRHNDTFYIEPNSSYLSKFAYNEELGEELNLYTLTPKINFKITNNSNKTIFFSKIVLNIESSIVDPVPIPIFCTSECYDGFVSDNFYKAFHLPTQTDEDTIDESNNILPIAIYNEGWSSMYDVKLDFNITDYMRRDNNEYNNLPFTTNLKKIDSESFIDIFPFLRKQGIDVEKIIEIQNADQLYGNDTALIQNGLGKYHVNDNGELILNVFGFISYNDINGKHYRYKFSTAINILRSWGCGAPALENGVYDISLCPEGSNYEIAYPISNYIKTFDVDNFSVLLNCPKSSIHKIRVKLYYSAEKYIEKYINYHLIVPRRMVEDEVVIFKGNGKCIKTEKE